MGRYGKLAELLVTSHEEVDCRHEINLVLAVQEDHANAGGA